MDVENRAGVRKDFGTKPATGDVMADEGPLLRASARGEELLAEELEDTRLLQEISSRLILEEDTQALYDAILDAAVALMRSDMGSMQILHAERNELELLASRSFNDEARHFWKWVRADSGCTCGQALKIGRRAIAADIDTCEFMAGSEDLITYRNAGIRAVQSTPLVSRSGKIVGMISTHWRKPHRPPEHALALLDVLARQAADLIERRSGEEALRESEARAERQNNIFAELIERCPFGMYIVDSDFRIASMNRRSQETAFANVRPVIGRSLDQAMCILWPEEVAREITGHFRNTLDTGEAFYSRDFVRTRSDVEQVEGYEWELHRTTLPDGRPGVICYYFDSTELRTLQRELTANERRLRLLIAELNHRVKNTLAVVQALAQQTFQEDRVPADVRDDFEGRLDALARAHNVLTREHWASADLADIVSEVLDACGVADRAEVAGPPVRLEPRIAVTVSMAIHELCTNAFKYGALSVDKGHVSLDWRIASSRLVMRWQELDGPRISPPDHRGFGSRMIERAVASDLKAEVNLDFRPQGLLCTIDAPLLEVLARDAGAAELAL